MMNLLARRCMKAVSGVQTCVLLRSCRAALARSLAAVSSSSVAVAWRGAQLLASPRRRAFWQLPALVNDVGTATGMATGGGRAAITGSAWGG